MYWKDILSEVPGDLRELFYEKWDGEMVSCVKCESDFPNHGLFVNKYNKHYRCRSCKGVPVISKQIAKIFKDDMPDNKKYCPGCKKVLLKTSKHFGRDSRSKDGFRRLCKGCRSELEYERNKEYIKSKRKQHYLENKERIDEANRAYRIKNREWFRQYGKQYYIEHKEEMKENAKIYLYRRIESDIGFKILQRCRSRLYDAIKGTVKSARTQELIGCTVEHLLEHLESQFQDGMTWDNYGKWHIDHIIPCSSFDFTKEEEQRKCFNYTNLQPLWAEDNYRKSDKIEVS